MNNLGFGGSNAHCILERAPIAREACGEKMTGSQTINQSGYKLFPLSGHKKTVVEKLRHELGSFIDEIRLKEKLNIDLLAGDIAYTLCHRRSHMPWRMALAASSCQELCALIRCSASLEPPYRATKVPKLAFIFTGQGAQWNAMGRELFELYPHFKNTMVAADDFLQSLGADFSLIDELAKDSDQSLINEPHIAQPACTATQIALAELLSTWGIRPAAALGHSSGEIAAAFVAGSLTFHDALVIAYHRGSAARKLKEKYPDIRGAMLAVNHSMTQVDEITHMLGLDNHINVACENSPLSTTASGDAVAIDKLAVELDKRSIFNKKLRVDIAYHSAHMKLIAADYSLAIQSIKPTLPKDATLYSSLYGRVMDSKCLPSASYWTKNLTEPVLFSSALVALINDLQPSVLLELGPHSTLQGPIRQILQSMSMGKVKGLTEIKYIPSLVRNQSASKTMVKLAGDLYQLGQILDFGAINNTDGTSSSDRTPSVVTTLKPYPWEGDRYWFESRISQQRRLKSFGRHDLLGVRTELSSDLDHTWRNIINMDNLPWLKQHKMQGLTTFPLAGYLSMVVEAVYQRSALRGVAFDQYVMRQIYVSRPLLLEDDKDYEMILSLRPYAEGTRSHSDDWDEFRITSWTQERGWLEHCHGIARVRSQFDTKSSTLTQETTTDQQMQTLYNRAAGLCDSEVAEVDLASFYTHLSNRGATYGSLFQLHQTTSGLKRNGQYAKGNIHVPNTLAHMPVAYETGTIIHPTFLDQIFHLTFAILGAGTSEMQTLYMPTCVKSLEISKDVTRIASSSRSMEAVAERHLSVGGGLSPADFTIEGWDMAGSTTARQPIIHIGGLQMTPVRDSKKLEQEARRLCFRMQWETLKGDVPVIANETGTAAVAAISNGALPNGHGETNGDGEPNGGERNDVEPNGVEPNDGECNGSAAMLKSHRRPIVIITDKDSSDVFISKLLELLSANERFQSTTLCSLDKLETTNTAAAYLALCDLDCRLVIPNMSSAVLATIRKLLLESASLLWVSIGLHKNAKNPTLNMIQGIIRTVRSEYGKPVATLDLDPDSQLSIAAKVQLILDALDVTHDTTIYNGVREYEFAEEAGQLVVPRMVPVREMDEYLHRRSSQLVGPYYQDFGHPGRRLKLEVGDVGSLDSLYFKDEEELQLLPDDEIEVKVAATGANFKDAVIAVGHLSSPYIGIECSGTVTRVGTGVQSFDIGDDVCCMSLGAYSTFTRSKATSAVKVPKGMSMEVAASIPVAFCTAYYGLIELANLQPGERVLIHAGAGGVGQAAIQVAAMIGAEVYTTVGSIEKKQLLISQYGVREDHIFYSRSTEFGQAIRAMTAGVGVDVALNSLAGDKLRETWDCMADFGRFIEIGKRDITWNTRLEMNRFDRNVTFSSLDLTLLGAKRPSTMSRVINAVMDLFAQEKVSHIAPITVMGISETETALRLLQSGRSMGKIVISPQTGEQVKVITTYNISVVMGRQYKLISEHSLTV